MSEEEWDKVCFPICLLALVRFKPCPTPRDISWHGHLTDAVQCWSANVKVPRALLLTAKPTFDSNPDGGLMITTGSIAVCRSPSIPNACV